MKHKICIIHENLNHYFGGSSHVCVWIIESLKHKYELYLASSDRLINFQRLNRFFGTNLTECDIKILYLPLPYWLRKLPSRYLRSFRLAYNIRYIKSLPIDFDLFINTANDLCLPFKTIHYVHFPEHSQKIMKEFYPIPVRWLRYINNILFYFISGLDKRNFYRADAVFVTNSYWSAKAFQRAYGRLARVIYPPVAPVNEASYQNQKREKLGFVCIGRLTNQKKIHEAISIVDELRKTFRETHLHIIGNGKGKYAAKIREMARKRNYIFIHSNISKKEMANILKSHPFGIHTTRNEHFGLAPAEMLSAGQIVFVHNSGGQVEIVNKNNELVFDNPKEAVAKISKVLKYPSLQNIIQMQLISKRHLFSVERFNYEISCFIDEFLKKN